MSELLWRGASIDLTPQNPIALAGKAGPARISDREHSPLEANATLLCDESGQAVLVVAMDLMYVGAALQRHLLELAAELRIAPQAVWLAASHTHFAPGTDRSKPRLGAVDDAYLDWLRDRCSELIQRVAAASPLAVRAEVSTVSCAANVNRRCYWPWPTLTRDGLRLAGSIVMAPAPQAPRDTELTQVRFVDAQGRCRALWWKYACHPVSLPLPTAVSAEYPGEVRARLRALTGQPDMPVVFLQGFAGDVRPWIGVARDARSTFDRLRSGPGFGTPSLEQWQQWADKVAQCAVDDWAPGATWARLWGGLEAGAVTVSLAELLDNAPPGELTLQRLALGHSLELLGGNAEFCSPWLRWQRPGRSVVHVGYLGQVFGYLPDERQVLEGGYESVGHFDAFGLNSRWRKGFEVHLDTAFRRLCPAC